MYTCKDAPNKREKHHGHHLLLKHILRKCGEAGCQFHVSPGRTGVGFAFSVVFDTTMKILTAVIVVGYAQGYFSQNIPGADPTGVNDSSIALNDAIRTICNATCSYTDESDMHGGKIVSFVCQSSFADQYQQY